MSKQKKSNTVKRVVMDILEELSAMQIQKEKLKADLIRYRQLFHSATRNLDEVEKQISAKHKEMEW